MTELLKLNNNIVLNKGRHALFRYEGGIPSREYELYLNLFYSNITPRRHLMSCSLIYKLRKSVKTGAAKDFFGKSTKF